MKAKYIIVECHGLEVPIVFSPILQHKDIAGHRTVLGAGFCHLGIIGVNDNRRWSVWGHSQSLNIQSRPEDAEVLNTRLEIDC